MSTPNLDDEYAEAQAQAQAVASPNVETSRLAVLSLLASTLCVPGVSGLAGVVLGTLALRQINRSQYIVGANLAWLGILGGVGSLLMWAGVAQHVLGVRQSADDAAGAFFAAWSQGEAEGEAAADPGLAPLMRRGGGADLQKALKERAGAYQGLGPRTAFHWEPNLHSLPFSESFSASYPVRYQSGAPVQAELDLARGDDKVVRVVGYRLVSPVLRDLDRSGATEQHATAAKTLHAYDAEGGGPGGGGKSMKEFRGK